MRDRALNRYIDRMAGIENEEKGIISEIKDATDIPESRIRAVVEAMDGESDDADGSTIPLSQSPSTDASPRPSQPRRLGVNDISYLSDREFARVLGLTLEQFDGNTVRPLANETVEVDLLWNRAETTIGLRTVSSTDEVVGESHITSLLRGSTTSEVTRAPSYLAVVTNSTFSDEAEQKAEDNDIYLFDGGHLKRWFRRALIPFDAVGTVLEEGENHDGPLDELVTLPTPPEPRCGVNPLELGRISDMQTETADDQSEMTRERLLNRLQSLQDSLDRLPKASDVRDMPGVDEEDYLQTFGSWDEALQAAGLDKERALLDEIRRVAEKLGETPSYLDIGKYGHYSGAIYREHFGSWSSAVEQSGIKRSDDPGSDSSDREAMVESIRELHEELGRIPKTTGLPNECDYSPNDFYSEFGSWDEALEAAGINKERALLNEIERVAKKIEDIPNSSDMDEHGVYSGSTYSSYFESWSSALKQSGVKESYDSSSDSGDREAMLEFIRELHEELGHVPKTTELPKGCEYSQYDFYSEFGSWDEALGAAGIDKEQGLLNEIGRVAEKIERVPSTSDMNEHGVYSSGMYPSYFDSWSTALEQSGVREKHDSGSDDPVQNSSITGDEPGGTNNTESHSRDEILAEIDKVQRIVHREPTRDDFKTNANIPINVVDEQFDSWKTAVNAAAASDAKDGTSANDEQSSPGDKGVLYADPDEDGDYQMFDDYLEEL